MSPNVARVLGESGPDGSMNPFPPPGRSYPELPAPRLGVAEPRNQDMKWVSLSGTKEFASEAYRTYQNHWREDLTIMHRADAAYSLRDRSGVSHVHALVAQGANPEQHGRA